MRLADLWEDGWIFLPVSWPAAIIAAILMALEDKHPKMGLVERCVTCRTYFGYEAPLREEARK